MIAQRIQNDRSISLKVLLWSSGAPPFLPFEDAAGANAAVARGGAANRTRPRRHSRASVGQDFMEGKCHEI